MSGNAMRGEHHLLISNATVDDDGDYQCQVAPAKNSKAIWANAKLTVLCKYAAVLSVSARQEKPKQSPVHNGNDVFIINQPCVGKSCSIEQESLPTGKVEKSEALMQEDACAACVVQLSLASLHLWLAAEATT